MPLLPSLDRPVEWRTALVRHRQSMAEDYHYIGQMMMKTPMQSVCGVGTVKKGKSGRMRELTKRHCGGLPGRAAACMTRPSQY